MKTIVLILLCIFTGLFPLHGQIDCAQLPQKTVPARAVNDFAEVIDEHTQTTLERKLNEYWDTTSIAVSVITVQTMNGHDQFDYSLSLFNCWGIGGKSDRGVLLFIAINERKISIRTGYGIEFALTDAACGQITKEMGPYFKKKAYAEGISFGTNRILDHLGHMSWEDRLQGIAEEKAAKERKWQDAKNTLMDIVMVLGALLAIAFLVSRIRRWYRINKRRRAIASGINKLQQELTTASSMITEASVVAAHTKHFPQWAKKEAHEHANHAMSEINRATKSLENLALHQKALDLDKAEDDLLEIKFKIEKSFKNFQKLSKGIEAKVQKVAAETPERLADAIDSLTANIRTLKKLKAEGYNFDRQIREQESQLETLNGYAGSLDNQDALIVIYEKAPMIQEAMALELEAIQNTLRVRENVEKNLGRTITDISELDFESPLKAIEVTYQNCYPPSVWEDSRNRLLSLKKKLSKSIIEETAKEINFLNNLHSQEFTKAAQKFTSMVNNLAEAQEIIREVNLMGTRQDKARKDYESHLDVATSAMSSVLHLIKNSDVSSSTKTQAKNKQALLSQLTVSTSEKIVDWIAAWATLNDIISKAKDLSAKAQRDIDTAEETRRRKRREEEEERLRAVALTSSYTSSYSSSSSDSGFGGFDGGSSGGGGSDGGW